MDNEIVLDEHSLPAEADCLPPGLREQLRRSESERQAAFGQMGRMLDDIGRLKRSGQHRVAEIERVRGDALYRLAVVAEFRRGGGVGDIARVGAMSAMLAHVLGYDPVFCERMQMAAPLRDIGEIGVPDSLLGAPDEGGDCLPAERRAHCQIGHDLLADSALPEMRLAALIALNHHERYDGGGYPNARRGTEIPLAAGIVAVIDAFESLTASRAGEPPMLPEAAIEAIRVEAGRRFDPAAVQGLIRIGGELCHIRRLLDDESASPLGRRFLGRPLEPGFWRRFV